MKTEFEDFLFAPLGEQANGMPVSVCSALARLNIDPWREAGRLSDLPKDRAIQALRGSIDCLIDLREKNDAAGIAARLIRLLPSHRDRVRSNATDTASAPRRDRPAGPPGALNLWARLPLSAWLLIGALAMIAIYVIAPGGAPSESWSPSSYDYPVREQPRR